MKKPLVLNIDLILQYGLKNFEYFFDKMSGFTEKFELFFELGFIIIDPKNKLCNKL